MRPIFLTPSPLTRILKAEVTWWVVTGIIIGVAWGLYDIYH